MMPQKKLDYILEKQVEAIYIEAPVANLTIFFISTLFVFILSGHVDINYLISWSVIINTSAIYRLFLWYKHRSVSGRIDARYWLHHYTIASLFVGISWSLVYLFLFQTNELVIIIALFMLIFGILSAAVAILSIYLPLFIVYTYPQIIAMSFVVISFDNTPMYFLTISLYTYLIMLTLFSRNTGRQFLAQVTLAYENKELVSQREKVISERTEELGQTNDSLKKEVAIREQAENKQQIQYNLLRSVLDATPDLIFYKDYKDKDGKYIGSNEAFNQFVGRSPDNIIGKNDLQLLGDDIGSFSRSKDREVFEARETRINEEWVSYPDGRKVLLSTLRTPFYDSDNNIIGVLGVSRDMTVQKNIEEKLREKERSLRHLAHHDPLTELPNRLLMIDRLQQSIQRAARSNHFIAILFIDLDHFKEINDSLGHTAGDKLLRAVAERLKKTSRREDTVARLGGDEFTIIFELSDDLDAAGKLAGKIFNAFNTPFMINNQELNVTTSIGISLYPKDGSDTESLLKNADAAMYHAKSEGRNAFRFYSAEMTERARMKLLLEADLRRALIEHQFELFFQPQIEINTGQITAVEALIRWRHPEKGLLSPDSFIETAEETGLITEIDNWVFHYSCNLLSKWQTSSGPSLTIAINVSGRELSNSKYAENIISTISESGCNSDKIELEITESFLVQHPEKAKEMLEQIRSQGIRIAIDDFGTGYSSLSYLKQFPISKLKIDRSFVRDIPTDSNDRAICSAIIVLGKALGLTVIAEGVENSQQVEFLKSHDCDQAQGYLYAKPMAEKELLIFLENHKTQTVVV
ncbi:MAG: EAL domain-containing protein [Bacteroidales bacterium]|nr:EAL domain-containing protein [Bacteroidales bacterium]